jgi:MFS family permease
MKDQTRRLARTAGGLSFVLFCLVLVFDYADQGLLSPFINPLLQDFFRTTANVVPLGWVTFTFTLLSAASTIAAGLLADRRSRVRLCIAGGLVYGTFSALTALAPHGTAGFVVFFVTRALNGLGVGLVVPAVFSLVGDLVAPARRATAFGFMSVAMLAGRFGGFAVAGAFDGDWRRAYLLVGAVNILLAAGLLVVREPRRGGREDELREAILEGAEYRFRLTRKDIGLLRAARSNFWLVLNFVDVFPGSIVLFLIFKYMKDIHNLEAPAVNFTILVVALAGAAGALVFGRIGDLGSRKDRRAKVVTALLCNSLPIVFMVLFLLSDVRIPAGATLARSLATPGMVPLVLTIAAAIFINQGVNPNWYGTLTDINLPEHRAAMISLASVMDMIGSAIGPLVGSYIASAWGLKAAMGSVLAFWVLNVVFWLPVLAHVRADLERVHETLAARAEEMKRSLPGHAV